MNSSDLLLVELYNDSVKIFNLLERKHFIALVSHLDEHVLENLCERQANKFTLMKNAMTLLHQDILVKKKQEATTDLRSMVNDILEQQQQKMLRNSSAERQHTPKTGRSLSAKEDRSPCFNHKRGNCSDDRDCDISISCIANTSRKTNAKWERIAFLFTRKRRRDLPVLHEREEGRQHNPTTKKHWLQNRILQVAVPT